MQPPLIRFPLLWLAGLLLIAFSWPFLWLWSEPLRWATAQRVRVMREGPPVPSSNEPVRLAGPLSRRVLLLREGQEVTARPEGTTVQTIGKRIFADVYDLWPTSGEPTHYRIGNRSPMGWVPAAAVLPWNTRLVVRLDEQHPGSKTGSNDGGDLSPLSPVTDYENSRLEVVAWQPRQPWVEILGTKSLDLSSIAPNDRGVLLSREELLILLQKLTVLSSQGAGEDSVEELTIRAMTGRLGDLLAWSDQERARAREALPAWAMGERAPTPQDAFQLLSRRNSQWTTEVAWSGVTFQMIPLSELP